MAQQAPPSSQETKLDEIVWRSPPYLASIGGYINPNTVLHYFRESPFFDRLCNNNSLWTQAQFNPSLASLLHSREALEARLRTMTGTEFMVAAQAPESGLYIIRKQFRRGRRLPKYDLGERPDGVLPDGKMEDVRVEEVYFVIGENVYMAPKIGQALAGRTLSITNHLRNALRKVTALSDFTPSIGHHYISPQTSTALANSASGLSQNSQAANSSRAQTPLPNSQASTTGGGGGNAATTTATTTTASSSSSRSLPFHHELAELRTMPQSLQMSLKFHNEYMDSPPPPPPQAPIVASASSSTSLASSASQGQAAVVGGAGGGSYSASLGRAGAGGVGGGPGMPQAGGGGGVGAGGVQMQQQGVGGAGGAGGASGGAVGGGNQNPPPKKRRKSKAAGVGSTS